MRKLEVVQSFCSKMFVIVDYVRGMTVKKSCMYGECGSFGHLHF